MISTPCMDAVMMQPAECDTVFRVVSLSYISVPRYNVMRFDSFRTSAEPAGESVPLTHFVRPCGAAVLFDPVLVDVFFMWYRLPSFTIMTFDPVLDAAVATYNIRVDDIPAPAIWAFIIFPDISTVSDVFIAHQKSPFLKAFFGACSSLS